MNPDFLEKLIARLDKLDPESVQSQFLRLAHERGLLETIFQSIQEGLIVIDGAGRLSYANLAAEQMLGFVFAEVEGRPIAGYLQEIDWDRILKLDAGEWSKLSTHEIEITYPKHRFLSFYVVPLASDPGGSDGAVAILRDVTHDRENEASLLESERLSAMKLLAAGVAHEIGNPLNALNIHLQLLEREAEKLPGEGNQDFKELVEVARNEVARLDLIITQFLRAIRPAHPKLATARIEDVLTDSLALLKQEVQSRNIEIEVRQPETLPSIRVDRDQIKQAFFNVIRNALQAMSDGGQLTISLDNSDRYVMVSFRDTGTGIDPQTFGRIFEPYHTTKADGSGLGLMIVQRIVQDHGGQIDVESKPGVGTSFTIQLPLAERRVRLLRASGKTRDAGAPARQKKAR